MAAFEQQSLPSEASKREHPIRKASGYCDEYERTTTGEINTELKRKNGYRGNCIIQWRT